MAAHQIFQEKSGTNDYAKIGEVAKNISQFTVHQLFKGINYNFKIQAVGVGDSSNFSNIIKATTFAITSNEIENLEKYISIFPNPSSAVINFKVDVNLPKNSKVKIYSTTGSLILDRFYTNIVKGITYPLTISDLNAGTYLFEIQYDKGNFIKKLSKN